MKYVGRMTKVNEEHLGGADITERSEGSNATKRRSRGGNSHSNVVGADKRWERNRMRLRNRQKKAFERVIVCVFVDGLDDDIFSLNV